MPPSVSPPTPSPTEIGPPSKLIAVLSAGITLVVGVFLVLALTLIFGLKAELMALGCAAVFVLAAGVYRQAERLSMRLAAAPARTAVQKEDPRERRALEDRERARQEELRHQRGDDLRERLAQLRAEFDAQHGSWLAIKKEESATGARLRELTKTAPEEVEGSAWLLAAETLAEAEKARLRQLCTVWRVMVEEYLDARLVACRRSAGVDQIELDAGSATGRLVAVTDAIERIEVQVKLQAELAESIRAEFLLDEEFHPWWSTESAAKVDALGLVFQYPGTNGLPKAEVAVHPHWMADSPSLCPVVHPWRPPAMVDLGNPLIPGEELSRVARALEQIGERIRHDEQSLATHLDSMRQYRRDLDGILALERAMSLAAEANGEARLQSALDELRIPGPLGEDEEDGELERRLRRASQLEVDRLLLAAGVERLRQTH